jgi:hypothetical protein
MVELAAEFGICLTSVEEFARGMVTQMTGR